MRHNSIQLIAQAQLAHFRRISL